MKACFILFLPDIGDGEGPVGPAGPPYLDLLAYVPDHRIFRLDGDPGPGLIGPDGRSVHIDKGPGDIRAVSVIELHLCGCGSSLT